LEIFYFGQACLVSWRLPVPDWATLSQTWKVFWYYFVENISCPFGLQLFSFDAHVLQVWSFDGVTEFLCIPFSAFDSFV
jgi:hypothetical protein